jgi:hypothetical protein
MLTLAEKFDRKVTNSPFYRTEADRDSYGRSCLWVVDSDDDDDFMPSSKERRVEALSKKAEASSKGKGKKAESSSKGKGGSTRHGIGWRNLLVVRDCCNLFYMHVYLFLSQLCIGGSRMFSV